MDYPKQQHRGFGFMTFVHSETADLVCAIRYHALKDKTVECKMAQKKEFVKPNNEAAAAASTFLSSLPPEQVLAIYGALFKGIVSNGSPPPSQQIQVQQQIQQQIVQTHHVMQTPKLPNPIAPPLTSLHHPANQLNSLDKECERLSSSTSYRDYLARKYLLNQFPPTN
jgi:hypothetical protein